MKAQNLVKIIVFISLLLIPLALAEKINNLENNLEDVSLITKIVGNKAYVNHTKGLIMQEPYSLTPDNKQASISFETKSLESNYDLCFDFKEKENLVTIEKFKEKKLLIDKNLNEQRKSGKFVCMSSFKNNNLVNFDFEAVYHGEGVLKYDIYILPDKYNLNFSEAKDNNDLIILDPYLVGDLNSTNNLLFYLPFYNNIDDYSPSFVSSVTNNTQVESTVTTGNEIVRTTYLSKLTTEDLVSNYSAKYYYGTVNEYIVNVEFEYESGLKTNVSSGNIGAPTNSWRTVNFVNPYPNNPVKTIRTWMIVGGTDYQETNVTINLVKEAVDTSYWINGEAGYDFKLYKNANDIFNSYDLTDIGSDITYSSEGAVLNGSASQGFLYDGIVLNETKEQGFSWGFRGVPAGNIGDHGVMSYGAGVDGSLDFGIAANINLLSGIACYTKCNGVIKGTSSSTLTIGTEYDITCTVNSTHIRKYVNGVGSTPVLLSGCGDINNYGDKLYIGRYRSGANSGWNGTVSKAFVANRSFSEDEAIAMYKGDLTENILGESDSALDLDGESFIIIDNSSLPSGNSQRSSCIWFNSTASSLLYRSLYSLGNKPNNFGNAYVLSFISGKLKFSTWHGSDAYVSDTIPLNTWHHSCLVYNGSVLKSYVDGEYYKSINYGSINTEPISTFVGLWDKTYNPTYAGKFEGELDEFMVYNYALTSSDILALYNGWNNSIYFNVYDAKNPTVLITDNVTINLRNDDVNYSSSLSTTSGTAWINGVPEGILRITADSINYDSNLYYYTVSGTNEEIIFSIYLTNQTSTDIKDVLLHVIDNAGQELEGATINIFYQDPETGTYITYGNLVTNPNGEALTTLIPDSYFYIFTVTYGGEKCYETSSAFRIFATDDNLYFKCVVGTGYIEKRDAYNEVSTYLNHINTSNVSGYFTYEGNSSATTYFCLNVYENTLNQSLVAQNCSNTTAALLKVVVDSSSFTSDITYKAIATYIPFGYSIKSLAGIDFMTFAKNNKPSFGGIGLYIMFVLMITVAYLARKDPRFVIIGVAGVYAGFTMFKLIDIPLLPEKLSMGSGIVALLFAIIISFSISKSTKE